MIAMKVMTVILIETIKLLIRVIIVLLMVIIENQIISLYVALLNILVSKLLVVDPTNRLGAEDIIKHKWLERDKAIIRDI